MVQAVKIRTGIINDDLQSKFLNDVFDEMELRISTRITCFDLKKARGSLLFKAVRWYFRFVHRIGPNLSVIRAEHVLLLLFARGRRLHNLVALDNKLELVSAVAKTLKHCGTNCFVIQMGTNPRYYNITSRDNVEVVPVTMLCWGSRESNSYVRSGLKPETFLEVGSLKVPIAQRRNGHCAEKQWDLCIVSQFRPIPSTVMKTSRSSHFEAQTMPSLIQLLRPVIIRNQLRAVVAVKAGRRLYEMPLEEQEVNFYRSTLGDIADIRLSRNPYASYGFAQGSTLVIGRNSGLLTEMLDSNSRVLFVNPTDFDLFDAPAELPFRLSKPSESELEALILQLLNMTFSEYLRNLGDARQKFCINTKQSLQLLADVLTQSGRA